MRILIAFLIVGGLCGCASKKVLVDLDSCEGAGTVQDKRLGLCAPVEIK
jgi:hypothetical protein